MSLSWISRLEVLEKSRKENPYTLTQYHSLLAEERKINGEGPRDLTTWKAVSLYKAITPEDVKEWETAIETEISDLQLLREEKAHLYAFLKAQCPIPEYFDSYLNYADSSILGELTEVDLFGTTFIYDYAYGNVMFERAFEFFTLTEDFGKVQELFLARLKENHLELEDTYQEYSKFVTEYFPGSYSDHMRLASKAKAKATEKSGLHECHESRVNGSPDSPEVWRSYIDAVFEMGRKDNTSVNRVLPVFFRSLYSGSECKIGHENWYSLWVHFIDLLRVSYDFRAGSRKLSEIEDSLKESSWRNILTLFAKCYPQKHRPYTEFLRCCDLPQEYFLLQQRLIEEDSLIHGTTLQNFKQSLFGLIDEPNEWRLLAIDFLRVGNALVTSQGPIAEEWEAICALLSKEMLKEKKALSNQLVQLLLFIWRKRADSRSITDFIEALLKLQGSSTEFWVLAMQYGVNSEYILKNWELILRGADDPSKFFDHLHVLQSTRNTFEGYRDFLARVTMQQTTIDEILRKALEKAEEPESLPIEDNSVEEARPKRQKVETTDADPVRSREQFRIKIGPLDEQVTETNVRNFLDGYGDPLTVNIHQGQERFALVELRSEREVLTCLTRDVKPLDGQIVHVGRVFGNTVWVANYPLSLLPDQVEKMVETYGGYKPLAIRFPSQKDNIERRFCYADFESDTIAAAVQKVLSGLEVEDFKLEAEISNPSLRKTRVTAPTSHQIYVHNLNFKETTESSLREFFGKFGDVETVKIPLTPQNRAKGLHNNGYAFVTFTTETAAKEAISLGVATIDGRRILISAVNKKAANQKAADHYNDSMTITIHNVNEVVTQKQLKSFLEEKVGSVARMQLLPSKNIALVEFTTVKDAGNASMVLEGTEFLDNILHIGLKQDFKKDEPEVKSTKVPKMVPSILMRRRRK